ncbi:2-hydroxyacylsphingosine 1-beta-galactosyltransferase [Fusarium beomiforme]|uniref:2-hydroxyacylsphingosine 1-beta-galactosyltransferase n=1 Tax=Fusarium beomiforme TaxID=44412 RepID=A0A9P5DY00_9HYPO|nr:2-hydroxyacylsphingosine 1-beta-galactosyltransferase [Fusarium beomiforme]
MFARLLLITALVAVLLACFLSGEVSPEHAPYIQGRNKTVLFLTNSEHGLSNVHFATASALLENYPDIEVHFASFPTIKQKLERVSSFAKVKSAASKGIIFHDLKGLTFAQAIAKEGRSFISPPGWRGIATLAEHIQLWISPWTFEDHVYLFEEVGDIIDDVDPAVIVLDSWFRPAIDATRKRNRLHAFITPNTLVDHFLGIQSFWTMLWKYPAPSSGFPFPVPLLNLPENIYMNIRYIYSAMFTPNASDKKARLREIGLGKPMNLFGIHRPDVPWITQNTKGAMIPVEVLPPNVSCAGPIVLSGSSAEQQDPGTAAWLKKSPTVLINLGSNLAYDESRATVMSIAIAELLSTSDYQVLWKFNKLGEFSNDFLDAVKPYLDNERLRMPSWLKTDPSSLLDTGDIVTSVHHGGSNCYHEALAQVPKSLYILIKC